MSYWYERFAKKHIICICAAVAPILIFGLCRVFASYAAGAAATGSRVVFDWLAVDYPITGVELIPYASLVLEDGCIEWLGFSSCEAVQFKDWMKILVIPEAVEITVQNVSNAKSVMEADTVDNAVGSGWNANQPRMRVDAQFEPVSAVSMTRSFTDAGTMSANGYLYINMHVRHAMAEGVTLPADPIYIPNFAGIVASANEAGSAQLLQKTYMKNLLEGTYYNSRYHTKSQSIFVPAKGTAYRRHTTSPYERDGVKNIYYYASVAGNKCWSPMCGGGCSWSTTCEPIHLGFSGLVMPSMDLWYPNIAFMMHKPIIPWSWMDYIPGYRFEKISKSLQVYNPEAQVHMEMKPESEKVDAERFPGVKAWLWKSKRLVPICKSYQALIQGKDCNAPAGMVNVDFAHSNLLGTPYPVHKLLYVSLPAPNTISSETVSGLCLDFDYQWTLHAMVPRTRYMGKTNGNVNDPEKWIETYTLFTTKVKPTDSAKLLKDRITSDFQDFGADMKGLIYMFTLMYVFFLFLSLFMILYAATCVQWIGALDAAAPKVDYI